MLLSRHCFDAVKFVDDKGVGKIIFVKIDGSLIGATGKGQVDRTIVFCVENTTKEKYDALVKLLSERRIFHINVGNLPRQKAEEYIKTFMDKFKDNKYGESYYLPITQGDSNLEIKPAPDLIDIAFLYPETVAK